MASFILSPHNQTSDQESMQNFPAIISQLLHVLLFFLLVSQVVLTPRPSSKLHSRCSPAATASSTSTAHSQAACSVPAARTRRGAWTVAVATVAGRWCASAAEAGGWFMGSRPGATPAGLSAPPASTPKSPPSAPGSGKSSGGTTRRTRGKLRRTSFSPVDTFHQPGDKRRRF